MRSILGPDAEPSSWAGYSFQPAPEGGAVRSVRYRCLLGCLGRYRVGYAWGHGGQLIVVVRDAGMVVVTTAEYLGLQFGDATWRKESAVLELVGRFVSAL